MSSIDFAKIRRVLGPDAVIDFGHRDGVLISPPCVIRKVAGRERRYYYDELVDMSKNPHSIDISR